MSEDAKFGLGLGVTILVIVAIVTFLFAFEKTPQDKIGLSYGGGIQEGNTYQFTKGPGSPRFFNGWFDHLYLYPTTQRTYIISQRASEGDVMGADAIVVPASDGVQMEFETTVYFKLNLDLVREFHEQIGIKTHAYDDAEGWSGMLNDYFRKVEQSSLREAALTVTSEQLYCPDCTTTDDDSVITEIQNQIGSSFKEDLAEALGAEYFCGPTYTAGDCTDLEFTINSVHPQDPAVIESYATIRKSQNEVEVRRNEVEQAKLQREAIEQLTEETSLTCEYVILKAIEAKLALPPALCLQNGKGTGLILNQAQ